MSSILSPKLGAEFELAKNREIFFSKKEQEDLNNLEYSREFPFLSDPARSCDKNLFFGFFFDGTKNNYTLSQNSGDQSNIARLYDCYPGLSVPGVLPASSDWKDSKGIYKNFFKVYVPGVASPFKEVHDGGQGWEQTLGASGGSWGERRIIWALVQAINNVHRYFFQTPLVSQSEIDVCLRAINLNKYSRAALTGEGFDDRFPLVSLYNVPLENITVTIFKTMLHSLHAAVSRHWPDKKTGRPAKVDPAIVKTIYVSVFGFSRGATEARVFANWFKSLCKLDAELSGRAGSMSLGGFAVEFDFLGIFDTVASVGLANTTGSFHGHGSWADAEDSLRIPDGLKCLHLIAAHEPRRSFPVDSISVKGILPEACHEVVVPGAHSDVGGGYCPGEQGRGVNPTGSDMLSRIPLIMMYKAARLNGVPLKLEAASQETQIKFALQRSTIEAFNAYIASCKETQGPIHRLMREHMRKQLEWRWYRRISGDASLEKSESFKRASSFHKNDLFNAGQEFEEEVREFMAWLKAKGPYFRAVEQQAGFGNKHEAEREEIARWWAALKQPDPAVQHFFDDYVHDSRASFKLSKYDNEKDMHDYLKRLAAVRRARYPVLAGKTDLSSPLSMMTPAQQTAVDEYVRTGKIPRMYLGGREPWATPFGLLGRAGYLRFRRVYGGSDADVLS